MIPEGWREAKLQDVAPVIDCKHKTPRYTARGVPIVSPGNLAWGALKLNGCRTISEADHAEMMDHCSVAIGDVVFGRNQSVGVSSIVTTDSPFALGQDTVLIKPKSISPGFLHQWLQSRQFELSILRLQGGSTFGRINLKDLRAVPTPVPPSIEADRIAKTLHTWDRAIETVEALIANARAQKQALMQQLLPQGTTPPKKRLPRFSGEWREAEFNEVFDLKIGGTPARKNPAYWDCNKATQNRWVAISDLQGKYIDETQEHISDEGVHNSNVKALAAGTIIFSFKLSIGRKAILRKSAFTNEAICALIPKRPEELSSLFVFHALELIDFTASTDQAVKGATLNKAKIADLYLSFPPRAEQDRLVEVLEDADSEIANLQSQLTALRQEKAALMQQLLTGKRRVKLPESEVA